jgi:hypothetical protein
MLGPSCEFLFDALADGSADGLNSYDDLLIGYDVATEEVSSVFFGSEYGPFQTTLSDGAAYDVLEWSGPSSASGYGYEGTMFLY